MVLLVVFLFIGIGSLSNIYSNNGRVPATRDKLPTLHDYINVRKERTRRSDVVTTKTPTKTEKQKTSYDDSKIHIKNNTSVQPSFRSKEPVTHIGFLKVHKAGSTTMQNLLFRFALKHDLNILVPKRSGSNYFNKLEDKIPLKPGKHYDIFACHTNSFRKGWFESLLPVDSVNIAIVREPLSRMISSAYYYRDVFGVAYLKKVPESGFIHNLIKSQHKYDNNLFSHTRNAMGRDFGLRNRTDKHNLDLPEILKELDEQFYLVLIMERFHESLIMLKRLLKWSFIDILYLKTNSHEHNHTVLSEDEIRKFKDSNYIDVAIYEYFYDVFKKKLAVVGEDFHHEVAFFKTLLQQVNEFCEVKVNDDDDARLSIELSKWEEKFEVTKFDCVLMRTHEISFITKLRMKYLREAPPDV